MFPMGFYFHPADLLMIPAIVFALWAQHKVRSAYARWSEVRVRSGITGAEVVRHMLASENIEDVGIECIPGEMTDHFDPQAKVVRLSEAVYNGDSIASVGIAAHETGHVFQHARGYAPMQLRQIMYPISSIGSTLAFPIIFIGMIMGWGGHAGGFGPILLNVGIWLFTAAVAFTVVTLPVEFNASSRALRALAQGGYLDDGELRGAKAVLDAAAMTYVAAAAAAILQLIRILLITQRRD
jgi:hypothetical protein